MELDIDLLERFNRLSTLGATSAAEGMSRMTDVDFAVEDAAVSLVTFDGIRRSLQDEDRVALTVMFTGELAGKAMLSIDEEAMEQLADGAMPNFLDGNEDIRRSAMTEIGNVVLGGFVNGWANHLEERIDIYPTKYVDDPGLEDLPVTATMNERFESALAFTSTLTSNDDDVDVAIYLFPTRASITFTDLRETSLGPTDDSFELEQLFAFNAMSGRGAVNAARKLTEMSGVDVDVDVSELSFVRTESLPAQVDDGVVVGVVLEFSGPPDGYVAILFDESSAGRLGETLHPSIEGEEITSKHRHALQEVGNIMGSGFVDGWANVLGTKIKVSPPDVVHDRAPAVLSSIGGVVGSTHEHAFVHDSAIVTPERRINCDVLAIPKSGHVDDALGSIPVETLGETEDELDSALRTSITYDDLS